MLLKAYFDDAGTHGHSEVVTLGGLVGTEAAWTALEEDWQAVIDIYRQYGVTAFRAYDCEVGEGDFQCIQKPIRDAISGKFASITAKHNELRPIWSSVIRDAWDQEADQLFVERYNSPFGLCFEWCVQQVSNWSTKYGGGSPIALIFSEQNDFQERMLEVFSFYLGAKHHAPLRTLTFGSYRDLQPLQAADQLATEINRYWRASELNVERFKVRKEIAALQSGRGLHLGGCYGRGAIANAAQKYQENLRDHLFGAVEDER